MRNSTARLLSLAAWVLTLSLQISDVMTMSWFIRASASKPSSSNDALRAKLLSSDLSFGHALSAADMRAAHLFLSSTS